MADIKSAYLKTLEAAMLENSIAAEAGKLTESEEIPQEILGVVNGHLCVGILRQEGEGTYTYHFYYPNMKPRDAQASFAPAFNETTTTEKAERSPVTEAVNDSPVLSFLAIFMVIWLIAKFFNLK